QASQDHVPLTCHSRGRQRYLTATHGQLAGQVSAVTTHEYVALQAGVGGSSPLAPQVRSIIRTVRTDCTAAKYSSRDRMTCRTGVRVGSARSGLGHSWRKSQALNQDVVPLTRKNAVLPVLRHPVSASKVRVLGFPFHG